MTDETPRTYPEGVPSWIDARHPDPDAAQAFYGALFGWTFEERLPPGAPGSYRIASVDGHEVSAIAFGAGPAAWTTYIAVHDAQATAARVADLAGTAGAVEDAGPGGAAGRSVDCTDPHGAAFGLWQARDRLGAQHVNAPGGWVFSTLRSTDPERAIAFYQRLFGWQASDIAEGSSTMVRLPGYGDHLQATSDPHIRERQADAPDGFADVVAALERTDGGADTWHVSFSVADRDRAVQQVTELGGRVHTTWDGDWTRTAEVSDPQGAAFRINEYAPAGGGPA